MFFSILKFPAKLAKHFVCLFVFFSCQTGAICTFFSTIPETYVFFLVGAAAGVEGVVLGIQ